MPGGLLNLISVGNQNVILNGNPSKTYFKTTYSKYTNFGLQKFRLDFNGQRSLRLTEESVFTFKISRYAELLMDTYLAFTLPHIWSPVKPIYNENKEFIKFAPYEFKWIENIGSQLIKNVRFIVGGQVIQEFDGQYMYNMVQRDFDKNKKNMYDKMTGNIPELNNPANANGNINTYPNSIFTNTDLYNKLGAEPSIRSKKLYIPLNIWFTLASKMAFPLISLQYSEFFIEVTLRPISELFVVKNVTDINNLGKYIKPDFSNPDYNFYKFLQTPPDVKLLNDNYKEQRTNWYADVHLLSTYCFLSNDETRIFAKKNQKYLVKQVYHNIYNHILGSRKIDIKSLGLVSNWMWYLQRSDIKDRNEWSNYSNWEYKNIPSNVKHLHNYIDISNNDAYNDSINLINLGFNTSHNISLNNDILIIAKTNSTPILLPVNIILEGDKIKLNQNEYVIKEILSSTTETQVYLLNSDSGVNTSQNIGNYNLFELYQSYYRNENFYVSGYYSPENQKSILIDWALQLNGKYRENQLPGEVYEYVEKYARNNGGVTDGLYCYNFNLINKPSEFQPSGALNMIKFKNVEFEINTIMPCRDPSATFLNICDPVTNEVIGTNKQPWDIYKYSYDLNVIEERYNILEFANGVAGLIFTR